MYEYAINFANAISCAPLNSRANGTMITNCSEAARVNRAYRTGYIGGRANTDHSNVTTCWAGHRRYASAYSENRGPVRRIQMPPPKTTMLLLLTTIRRYVSAGTVATTTITLRCEPAAFDTVENPTRRAPYILFEIVT